MLEEVVLVNEKDEYVGTMEKMAAISEKFQINLEFLLPKLKNGID